MKRFLWLCVIVVLFLICTGCGDTFRPVIIPNPPKFPDPRASHSVVVISDNNTQPAPNPTQSDRGSVMSIDVSGDTVVGIADVGLHPVHAVQQTANQVLVVNQSVPDAIGDSLTRVLFSNNSISNTTTITLPPNSAPNFVASTESTVVYVSLPGFTPPSLAVVNTSSSTVATLPVGDNPAAVAETPDGKKVYVANQGSNSISAFNTIDRSLRPIDTTLFPNPFSQPHWVVVRSDNQRVYVLNTDGSLVTIDPTSNGGITDKVIANTPNVGVDSPYMLYDGHLNRLYVPSGNQLIVLDATPSTPQILKTVPLPDFTLLGLDPVPATAVAVAALPDGTRAYVASVPSSKTKLLPSQASISSVAGNGTTATYTYTLVSGHDLTPGVVVTISGTGAGFDGTFQVAGVSTTGCDPGSVCFQVANSVKAAKTAVAGTAVGNNMFPQVTVVNTSGNTVKTTAAIPGFSTAAPFSPPICSITRFPFTMAAGGDSSRVYLASCDGGNVNEIDTSTDLYLLNLPAPASSRKPNVGNQPPPQNPVFMIAGP
ncbi:MAG TPA: beta-propeller fold lactonase family protein [Terriglobales bacterium]|jgi:DNA-binding beta-propeller fold protein YncE|nr:beta-propeller fold lactonase family protein [Terriglobales bacterium]